MESSLTPLQRRALVLVAGMDPAWTLTGGGALAGFHLAAFAAPHVARSPQVG